MDLEAWYLDKSEDDQRKPHRQNPNQPVSLEQLEALGVFYWKVTKQLPLAPELCVAIKCKSNIW